MKIILTFALALSTFLTACATMDAEKCQDTNWEHAGQVDGRNGRPYSEFRRDEAKCFNLGTPLDSNQYLEGYARGIRIYCTRGNGMFVGARGEDYHKQCPASLESEFLIGYVTGKRDYDRNKIEKARVDALSTAARASENQCVFDSDCKIKRSCEFSRCEGSKIKCTFDSDCEFEGSCDFGKCR